eukprot:COSAG06_NODE_60857_length_269_cov_1.058824_1_plen_45_part_10
MECTSPVEKEVAPPEPAAAAIAEHVPDAAAALAADEPEPAESSTP